MQNQGRVASSDISPKLYIIYSEEKNLQVSCFFEWRSTHFSLIVSCHFFTNVVYAYTHVIYAKDCIVKRAQTSKTVSRAGLCRAVGQLILMILSLIANQTKLYLFYPISVRTTRAVILDFRTYHESFIFTFSLLCKVFLVRPRWGPKLIKNAQYKTKNHKETHKINFNIATETDTVLNRQRCDLKKKKRRKTYTTELSLASNTFNKRVQKHFFK